jgi:hypothetical protein
MQETLRPVMHPILMGALILFLVAWGFPALASTRENCQLKMPPRQAAAEGNHGFFFFVYPRSVNADYSGCQTMWDEKGIQWFVLTFEQGNLIKYEASDPSNASEKRTCRYENGKLARNDSKNCPDYGDVKDGFRTLPSSHEPIVPPERDPRR